MRILSIDFDYLVDADATTRCIKFPDGGNENLANPIQDLIWSLRYLDNPDIKDIGILEDAFKHLVNISKSNICNYTLISAISHKALGDYLLMLGGKVKEPIEVVNVDFHSDLYNIGKDLNCGNWANKAFESIDNFKLTWIKREDSSSDELNSLEYKDKVSISSNIKDVQGKFDVIFLARSDMWSPPHLDKDFQRLVDSMSEYAKVLALGTLKDRYSTVESISKKTEEELVIHQLKAIREV